MKSLVILGAGTGGTMVANHVRHKLPHDWALHIVDPSPDHLYQPGLLFLPFGARDEHRIVRARSETLGSGVQWRRTAVEDLDAEHLRVRFKDGEDLSYDLLVIASGSEIRPEETEGLLQDGWGGAVHTFYSLDGALALRSALEGFREGRLVVNVVEMPIKCPVAPLEFLFLADAFFTEKGCRNQVELVYATPLDGAFTKPVASRALGSMLEEKGIRMETEFNTGEVDRDRQILRSWDEREVPFDLLVSIPTHGGAPFIGRSGLGNELDFVPTEHHTLRAQEHDHIFVLGDATDLPSSKAGSVAHFQSEVVAENVLRSIRGESLQEGSDGHSNCFIESGFGKALLIDFNYQVEPLPGTYPLPLVGPFSLLRESRLNHFGKLAFRWLYWNALLPGRPLPVSGRMSMVGKRRDLVAA